LNRLLAFESSISLASNVCGGATTLAEEAREDRLNEGSEDDLGTASDWEGHPEDQDKLEYIVEWEPVDSIDQALKNGEEGINDPVCQPLSVIDLASTEERIQRIVSWDYETGKVDQEFTPNVKEDEEEVEPDESEEDIDLGNAGLFLEVVEDRIFRELLVELRDLVLSLILERHFGRMQVLLTTIVVRTMRRVMEVVKEDCRF
jgi:hypothetical protein